ncbi:MAG: transcriptional repressor LexA [Alphaproteobacteria bacterium]|nr:transcriptional repressor LexA [Alphaproteobacteria bacterium]
MLTKKQKELLTFINERLEADGVSPSFDEMKDALNLKSKSGIHRLISGLEERGFIRRLPHKARALEVIRMPETTAATHPSVPSDKRGAGFQPNVIPGNFAGPKIARNADAAVEASQAIALPLYGKIAAGTPIEALQDPNRTVDIPSSMVGRGTHYALEVDGDSMIEAGINDGDTVIINPCEAADNGTIVVALVDGEEATLKYWHRQDGRIALKPANPAYETQIFPEARVKVQGRLVGLIRQY